jgi:hypothetical protein
VQKWGSGRDFPKMRMRYIEKVHGYTPLLLHFIKTVQLIDCFHTVDQIDDVAVRLLGNFLRTIIVNDTLIKFYSSETTTAKSSGLRNITLNNCIAH